MDKQLLMRIWYMNAKGKELRPRLTMITLHILTALNKPTEHYSKRSIKNMSTLRRLTVLLANVQHQICDGCQHLSVVHSMVVNRKLTKIDPEFLWNNIRKLTSLILLPYSYPPPPGRCSWFKLKIWANINMTSCSVLVSHHSSCQLIRPSHHRCCRLL